MTADQELAVEALTRGIVNKIMHTPISTLKTAARDPESTTVIDLVRRLFNLHHEDREKETAASRAVSTSVSKSVSKSASTSARGPGDED